MLEISIIAVGDLKENYFKAAAEEYIKRLSAFCKLNIVEIKPEKAPLNPNQSEINNVLEKEGQEILKKIPTNSFVFSLCVEGKQMKSEKLAEKINDLAVSGKSKAVFIIGGSEGLSNAVKQKSDFKLSMSEMTFPHKLARVMLLEQIYRAFSINNNSKYHK